MRTKLANWKRWALIVVAVIGTQSGCKSGWKMPGSDMFPWSRKPSEANLASAPSLMPPSSSSSPLSPAMKNTPSPLASNAANPGRMASPYGPSSGSGPSFNLPPNNPTANNAAGVSAGNNGYATGPYNMTSNANRSGYTPPSGYAAPQQPAIGFGNAPPPQSALAGLPGSLPPAYGGMPTGMPQPTNNPGYGPMGNTSIPAQSASYNPAAVNSMPMNSSMPNALPSSYPPSNGASVPAQTYAGASPYQPGSVGRKTSYDFSNQGPGTTGLPPGNVPVTASGLPNGSPNAMYR